MDTEFLLERKLAKEAPELSAIYRNLVVVMEKTLYKTRSLFPDFTDHSLRHCTLVAQFCNILIGQENIDRLNVDEVFILLCACLTHDLGMCISVETYRKYSDKIVPADYFERNPQADVRDAVREFHQDFSASLIYKLWNVFEFPTEEHAVAIARVAKGHRHANLMDEVIYDNAYQLPNGNTVCLPYLATLICLADELDIAADRNSPEAYEEHGEIIDYRKHAAIKHMDICQDYFELTVSAPEGDVMELCRSAIEKLQETLDNSVQVIKERTPFWFPWENVRTIYLPYEVKRIVVLDTDAGTDDAMALALLGQMGDYVPDYIVASPGNTSLDGAVANLSILKKMFGFTGQIVKSPCSGSDFSSEKNTFHGVDGLAGVRDQLVKQMGMKMGRPVDGEKIGRPADGEKMGQPADGEKRPENRCMPDIEWCEFTSNLKNSDEIIYISIGPSTALPFLLADVEIKQRMSHFYIMGGGLHEFNCSHETEFNFSKAPDVVKLMFSSGVPITLFPLDLTNHQRLSAEQIDFMEESHAQPQIIEMLRWNLKANTEFNNIPAAVLHDTMPILYLAYPKKFRTETMMLGCDEYGKIYEANGGNSSCKDLHGGPKYKKSPKSGETLECGPKECGDVPIFRGTKVYVATSVEPELMFSKLKQALCSR